MRTLILTLAILVLIVSVANAQTGQPAPKPQGLITMDNPDKSVTDDKKRIQDRWDSQPGTTAKKTKKTKAPGNQPDPVKGNTP